MVEKYLILILLSTLAYSKIAIKVKPNLNGADSSIEYHGQEISDITGKDREIFKIGEESLKIASEKLMGKRCSSVYLKPPTPWGDVYKKYGWETVKKTVEPYKAKVKGVNSKPVGIGAAEYVNNHDSLDVTYSTSVSQKVSETASHTWNEGGEMGMGQEIKYEVNFGAGSVGGSTSLSYTASWGEDVTNERTISIGSTSSVQVIVPPNSRVVAQLIATQGTAAFEVSYLSRLNGKVFCNYDEEFKGHHFYALDLFKFQDAANLPLAKCSTETIKVGFYTNVRLEVSNGTGII